MKFIPPYLHPNQQQLGQTLELFIGQNPIKIVKETKFLGLIWDEKLTFKPHINYLKRKCMKAMNILKVLSHMDWGADQPTMLHIYRAFIRSKLDYGCTVYGSAHKSYLEKLDPIQNQCLRLCLGAFRTSPVKSLHVLADEPPLIYRRDKLALQYGIKLKAYPDNPAYEYVFPTKDDLYTRDHRVVMPFKVRLHKLLKRSQINITNVAENGNLYEHPLWDFPEVQFKTELITYKKEDTPPQLYHTLFNLEKEKYPHHTFIYTDGSKKDEKVAYAHVNPKGRRRILDGSSIYTAEAMAVLSILKYIKFSQCNKFAICSDSWSLIQAMQSQDLKNCLVISIFKELAQRIGEGKEVIFWWIPSHCGIAGNEEADREAKAALNDEIDSIHKKKLVMPYSDKLPLIKQFIHKAWQTEWNSALDNKLHNITPTLGKAQTVHTSRRDQVVFNRIRIGHTRLTHKCYFETPIVHPICHLCRTNSRLDIDHILLHCTHLNTIRTRYYHAQSMKDLFENINPDKILGFLKETRFYSEL